MACDEGSLFACSITHPIPRARSSADHASSVLRLPPICRNFSIRHIRHIPAITQKLHHLVPAACHFCPTRFRLRVLLQPADPAPLKLKIHLAQTPLRCANHRECLPAEFHRFRASLQRLPPNLNQRFVKRQSHAEAFHATATRAKQFRQIRPTAKLFARKPRST